MRGSNTGELVFENCFSPRIECCCREMSTKGVNVLMSGLDYEIAWCWRAAQSACAPAPDVVLPYVPERQFGQAIGEFQLRNKDRRPTVMNAPRACSIPSAGTAIAAGSDAIAADAILFSPRRPPGWRWKRSRPWAATAISTITDRPLAARRQALRDRRRHVGDSPHADRPGTLRRNSVNPI